MIVVPGWLDSVGAPWLCTDGCLFRQAERPRQQTALAPNCPAEVGLAGANTLQIYGFSVDSAHQAHPAGGSVGVRVDAVVGSAPEHAVLRVNLCLTGALGISAAVAPKHSRIVAAVAALQDIFADISVAVTVTYADVGGSPFVSHDVEDAELSKLFASGAGQPMGVNVFLVEKLTYAAKAGPLPISGLSGGIPGPVREVGGPQAGVAVSLQLGVGEEDRLGVAIAHELGHFLGLFHTEEPASPGKVPQGDQLFDTASGATDNLMYWSPQANSRKLSAQQRAVVWNSAWLEPK